MMKSNLLALVFVVGLGAAACGGDDDASDQSKVADLIVDAAADAGASPDSGCIEDLAAQISDAEAAELVSAGLQGDPQINDETAGLLAEMLLC